MQKLSNKILVKSVQLCKTIDFKLSFPLPKGAYHCHQSCVGECQDLACCRYFGPARDTVEHGNTLLISTQQRRKNEGQI